MSSDVAQPRRVEELAEILRDSERTRPLVVMRGAGTKTTWGATGAEPDLVVDTTGLDAVTEHAVGDFVVTAQSGMRLADLQQQLAAAGQWLPLDPPETDATIGGIVATAASGPHRLRFGTPRDLIIGVTVVLADGTVAKSGGKVVKNVAGYDLGKLFTGSYGTLGVIASCTFKLQPLPPARRVVSVPAPQPGVVARAIAASSATIVAAEWDGTDVHVVVEASPAAADAMARELVEVLGDDATVSEELPAGFGARPWAPGDVALKVTHRLSALEQVVGDLRREMPTARLSGHLGSGVVWAGWTGPSAAQARAAVESLRSNATAYGGSVVVVDAPAEIKRTVDVWGPVDGVRVMRRVKERFDPDARLNRGRFVDGI